MILKHNPFTVYTHTHKRTHSHMQIQAITYIHTKSCKPWHKGVIPLLLSFPWAVRSAPGWSSRERRQAEHVGSASYLCLTANLQGQTQLRLLSNASAGLDRSRVARWKPVEPRQEAVILCRYSHRIGVRLRSGMVSVRVDWCFGIGGRQSLE